MTSAFVPSSESSAIISPSEFPDALSHGPVRGRGAGLNPGNRFEDVRLHVLGDHLDAQAAEAPDGRQIPTTILDDDTKSIINPVDSPDLNFSWTINPYRGCEHGCIYCYARPGHEYLGMSSGLDFETKILAKRRAPELLRKALARPLWTGEPVMMSGVTDPYQPVERDLKITRGCLEVLAECRQAVCLITKNRLILRDLDVLSRLREHRAVHAAVSITSLDPVQASKMEPRASSPRDRLETIRQLTSAGIPVTVMTAPIIPGLNDHEVPAILEAAREAGATMAGYVLLRLPYQIKDLFLDWLKRNFPLRAQHVESLIRQTHGGELYDASYFTRQRGEGPIAAQIRQNFTVFKRRFHLDRSGESLNTKAFRRPQTDSAQLSLFAPPRVSLKPGSKQPRIDTDEHRSEKGNGPDSGNLFSS